MSSATDIPLIDRSDMKEVQRRSNRNPQGNPEPDFERRIQGGHDFKTIAESRMETVQKLKKIILCSFTFMMIELIGGYLSNSIAVISDSLHMGADLLGYIAQLLSAILSTRGRNKDFSFGYFRSEPMGALFNCFLIWTLAIYVVYESIHRLFRPPRHFNEGIMLFTAFLAIILNIVISVVLVGWDKIQMMIKVYRQDDSSKTDEETDFNLRATIAHIQGDIVYSVGVFISALVIFIFPSFRFMDSLCTIGFSYIVLEITVPIFKDSMEFLLERTPSAVDSDKILEELSHLPNVENVHEFHVWALSSGEYCLMAHLRTSGGNDDTTFESAVKICIEHKINVYTIQIENINKRHYCPLYVQALHDSKQSPTLQ